MYRFIVLYRYIGVIVISLLRIIGIFAHICTVNAGCAVFFPLLCRVFALLCFRTIVSYVRFRTLAPCFRTLARCFWTILPCFALLRRVFVFALLSNFYVLAALCRVIVLHSCAVFRAVDCVFSAFAPCFEILHCVFAHLRRVFLHSGAF
jgi:hypothetical protein